EKKGPLPAPLPPQKLFKGDTGNEVESLNFRDGEDEEGKEMGRKKGVFFKTPCRESLLGNFPR
ncbi:hypothetical protein, partial [Solidesulfovibrio sp. C21]|uniref:hypothetical protein n=1 Tax=Solidesulfovibrio sp. C21 TaxID=3398613 RepID=UPI0039FD0142